MSNCLPWPWHGLPSVRKWAVASLPQELAACSSPLPRGASPSCALPRQPALLSLRHFLRSPYQTLTTPAVCCDPQCDTPEPAQHLGAPQPQVRVYCDSHCQCTATPAMRAGPDSSGHPPSLQYPRPQSCQKNMPDTNPGPQRLILILK